MAKEMMIKIERVEVVIRTKGGRPIVYVEAKFAGNDTHIFEEFEAFCERRYFKIKGVRFDEIFISTYRYFDGTLDDAIEKANRIISDMIGCMKEFNSIYELNDKIEVTSDYKVVKRGN